MQAHKFLALPIFRNSLPDWAAALGVALAVMLVLLVARTVVRRYHARLAATNRVEILEVPLGVLSRTTLPFFLILSLFIGLRMLDISPGTRLTAGSALTVAIFWQTGIWATAAAAAWFEIRRHGHAGADAATAASFGVIAFIVQAIIWAFVILLALDNLGVNITALVAGLGVGGVAVALAVQNILGDLFASLSIAFDRPFVVGDFLVLGEFMGSVEHVGIKSTRLRSLSGEQIVLSNADLLKSRVRNYGRMNERRVVFTVGVTYETPTEQLLTIPRLIRGIIESRSDTRFDRSHFAAHGAASLDFESVYYVLSADYNLYMDIQQDINLRIHREFEKLGVEFAYPTQRLLLERSGHLKSAAEAA
ncbi:MAG TPA: mechanosensitive ion channel family protein [Steroidobacteraceae bacterium]|nr:mechanosensitive ion channel family protein [Steroidobacteraceae bacterium]